MIRNCAPLGFLASASSFSLSACSCSELRTSALSVTQAVGLGGMSRASAAVATHNASATAARDLRTSGSGGRRGSGRRRVAERVEVHLRRFLRSGGAAEVRLLREPASGHEVGRKLLGGGVVGRYHVVVALALDGDAILGSLELRLQLEEVLIRFQVRVALDDDQEARQRPAQ